MNTLTITITGNTLSLSGNYVYEEKIIKGITNVDFDFTSLDVSNNAILRAKIDYGDGSEIENVAYTPGFDHENQPITYYFALYGAYSPLLIKSHIYHPPEGTSYFNSLTAGVYLELTNNRAVNFYFPLKIAQPSYYEDIKNISVATTQLVSVSSSDVFCTIHSKTGDIQNIVLL